MLRKDLEFEDAFARERLRDLRQKIQAVMARRNTATVPPMLIPTKAAVDKEDGEEVVDNDSKSSDDALGVGDDIKEFEEVAASEFAGDEEDVGVGAPDAVADLVSVLKDSLSV